MKWIMEREEEMIFPFIFDGPYVMEKFQNERVHV
jgi:hypothetical protein